MALTRCFEQLLSYKGLQRRQGERRLCRGDRPCVEALVQVGMRMLVLSHRQPASAAAAASWQWSRMGRIIVAWCACTMRWCHIRSSVTVTMFLGSLT